jgi:hypothetical protein
MCVKAKETEKTEKEEREPEL